MEYFITEGSKTVGPFTKEQLKQKNISSSTLVFTDDTNWVEAKMIPDLADIFRRIPPPPPPKINDNEYHSLPVQTSNTQKNKGWLYSLLVVLGLAGGGGFMYQEHIQTQKLQDEVRANNMQRQEEQARAERESRRMKIETEKREVLNRKSSLQTELSVQQDKLTRAQSFQLLRTPQEREDQIRTVNTNLRSIENAIRECDQRLQELENIDL